MAWSEVIEIAVDRFPYQFHLHGLSDLQMGSESSSLRIIKARIDEICDDPVDSGVVILGDIEDEDRPSTRIIRQEVFADRPEVWYRDAQKHMAWIDKEVIPHLLRLQNTKYGILGVLAGHHFTLLSPMLNSVQYICNVLAEKSHKKVAYLGEMSSFLDFRFRSIQNPKNSIRSVGHIQHGEGSGQTKGSSLNKIERTAQGQIADWYMRAHDCQLLAAKTPRLYPQMVEAGSEPKLLCKDVVYLNLGSATQGYDFTKKAPSYVEQKMIRPTTMGWGSLYMHIKKARLHEDKNQSYRMEMKVVI